MGLLDALSAPVTGIINGISSAFQAKKNRQAQEKLAAQQFEYSKQLQAQQNEFNVDQWNRNNEYNTPEAIRQRYEAAGLNPASMMQGSTYQSAPVEASQDEFQMPGNPNYHNYQNAGTDMVQSFIGIKSMLADLKLKQAQAKAAEEEAKKTSSETSYQNILNKWADSSEEERINLLRQNVDSLKASASLSVKEAEKIDKELPYIARMSEAQIQKLRSDSSLLMQQVATEVQKRKNLKAEVSQVYANIAYLKALKSKTDEEAVKASYDARISQLESEIKSKYGEKIPEAQLKRQEGEIYSIFMDNLEKAMRNQSIYKGIDTKGNPVNNILRMMQLLIGVDPFGGLTPPVPTSGDTSMLEPQVDAMMNKLLTSYSGKHSHITHKNPQYYNSLG